MLRTTPGRLDGVSPVGHGGYKLLVLAVIAVLSCLLVFVMFLFVCVFIVVGAQVSCRFFSHSSLNLFPVFILHLRSCVLVFLVLLSFYGATVFVLWAFSLDTSFQFS